jgi:hypothetical protein
MIRIISDEKEERNVCLRQRACRRNVSFTVFIRLYGHFHAIFSESLQLSVVLSLNVSSKFLKELHIKVLKNKNFRLILCNSVSPSSSCFLLNLAIASKPLGHSHS